ncbi:MAG: hypothetical protein ABIG34_03160 [Candidatus Peregrinibacteria bacterium]
MDIESEAQGPDTAIDAAFEAAFEKLKGASCVEHPETAQCGRTPVFANHFMEFFGSHAQVDKAGPAAARFIEEIPWSDDPLENAVIGYMVLKELQLALEQILRADKEFAQSRDDTPEKNTDVQDTSTPSGDAAGTHVSAASVVDMHETRMDRAIADSAAADEAGDIDGAAAVKEAQFKGSAAAGTVPRTFTVRTISDDGEVVSVEKAVPNWDGLPPGQVLARMCDWLPRMVVAVASGSNRLGDIPRLHPLCEKDATVRPDMKQLCTDVCASFSSLGESTFDRVLREAYDALHNQCLPVLSNQESTDGEVRKMRDTVLLPHLSKIEGLVRNLGFGHVLDENPMPPLPSERPGRCANDEEYRRRFPRGDEEVH